MIMPLADLLTAANVGRSTGGDDISIARIEYDSRRVTAGALFVAVPGFHVDGHNYARAAVDAGAVAVIAQHIPDPPLPEGVRLILVDDTRRTLAWLAAAFEGHPSRDLTVAGVTGTDGKTTTTTMLWAAWQAAGRHAGASTTVDVRIGADVEPNLTRQTTLEAVELQQQLRRMRDAGCDSAAIETSSHALELHRVDAVDYRIAVFTRVTSEHLDLHGDRESYLAAKARLADLVARREDGIAILDADDDFGYPALRQRPVAHRVTYSATGQAVADVRARDIHSDGGRVAFTAETPWGAVDLRLNVAGRFNVANALAALTAACASGAPVAAAAQGISQLERVSGRMERVSLGQQFDVVIDYAHTADALAKVLAELRAATAGRLWVVFGSAGERDRDKRPAMGRVAARLADMVVITDEDPRTEDRQAILDEISAGALAAGGVLGDSTLVIPDRHTAIAHAVDHAQPGDTVLLAGKGHESCIIIGDDNVPYSERDAAESALRRRLAR